ncbi:MAG: glycosyl hydrolase, partial [Alloprevotella sp.]|nr:glycosyl hydrolase [Alloprevotella sp.]
KEEAATESVARIVTETQKLIAQDAWEKYDKAADRQAKNAVANDAAKEAQKAIASAIKAVAK